MIKEPLPDELRDEEGIPEAIAAMSEAASTPWVMEIIRERKLQIDEEALRLQEIRRNEYEKAFMKTVKRFLRVMKDKEFDGAVIERIRRRARHYRRGLTGSSISR